MNRLHLIKPPSGWPDFLAELLIVFLGVLIALGAQQWVDNIQARQNVAAFRKAVDAELGENLGAYELRVRQGPCATQRLDQLARWQEDWRDGEGARMTGRIRRPIGWTVGRAVWDTGALSIVGHMPFAERLAYSALYSGLATYDNLRLREAAVWEGLYAYDQATRLSPEEVNALRGKILAARALEWSITSNWPQLKAEAQKLGIRPVVYQLGVSQSKICDPITFNGGSRKGSVESR